MGWRLCCNPQHPLDLRVMQQMPTGLRQKILKPLASAWILNDFQRKIFVKYQQPAVLVMSRILTTCTTVPLALVLLAFVSCAHAIGLGDIRLSSHIGENLHASIAVFGDTETLDPTCVHATLNTIDHQLLMTASAAVVTGSSGDARIEVISPKPVYEPATYLRLSVDCKNSIFQREYAVLLDAPLAADTLPVEPAATGTATTPPEPALKNHILQTDTGRIPVRPHHRQLAQTAPSAKAGHHDKPPAIRRTKAVHASLKLAPVLSLSEPDTPSEALNMPEAAPTVQAPVTLALDSQLAQRQQQIEQLRATLRQQQAQIQNLQSRLAPPPDRSLVRNKLFVAVAMLAILELLMLAVLLRDRQRQRQSIDTALAVRAPLPPILPDDDVFRSLLESHAEPPPVPPAAPIASPAAQSGSFWTEPEPRRDPEQSSSPMPLFSESDVQVEEISDITQEAEFWMSVNNPEKAILILEHQTSSDSPGHRESPAPWLYLLDLYRTTGQRDAYERLRVRFSSLFNARTLDFDEDPATVDLHQIEDYPHIIRNIHDLWRTDEVLPYLKSLMLANPEHKRIGFDLPVYRDILMLITLAQEISAIRHAEAGTVAPNRSGASQDDLDLDIPNIHEAFRVID